MAKSKAKQPGKTPAKESKDSKKAIASKADKNKRPVAKKPAPKVEVKAAKKPAPPPSKKAAQAPARPKALDPKKKVQAHVPTKKPAPLAHKAASRPAPKAPEKASAPKKEDKHKSAPAPKKIEAKKVGPPQKLKAPPAKAVASAKAAKEAPVKESPKKKEAAPHKEEKGHKKGQEKNVRAADDFSPSEEEFDDVDLDAGDDDFGFDDDIASSKFIDLDESFTGSKGKKKKLVEDDVREHLAEEILALSEDYQFDDVLAAIKGLDFFKSDNLDCMEKACDNPATTYGYCRYHYIKGWKDIKKKQMILQEGRMQQIIEDLINKYPFKYIEAVLNDLADEKSFGVVLKELNIDTTSEDVDEVSDEDMDDEDIAFETKVTGKVAFDDTE